MLGKSWGGGDGGGGGETLASSCAGVRYRGQTHSLSKPLHWSQRQYSDSCTDLAVLNEVFGDDSRAFNGKTHVRGRKSH